MVRPAVVVGWVVVPLLSMASALVVTRLCVRLDLAEDRDIRSAGSMYGRSLGDNGPSYSRPSAGGIFILSLLVLFPVVLFAVDAVLF